jgi:hypothetical protein
MRTVLALLAVSSLVACNPSKEDFAAKMAELTCSKVSECYGTEALAAMGDYDSVDACITGVTADNTTYINDEANCPSYDGAKAAACLESFETATCDDLLEESACDDVCGDAGSDTGR